MDFEAIVDPRWNKLVLYAKENPVKFVAVGSFCVLGAIPLLAFLAYGVSTLIATIVGAIIVELFLLAVGITGLAFILFFATCIAVCATSVFAAVYFSYRAASSTLSKTKSRFVSTPTWPFTSTTAAPNDMSEPQPDQGGDTDKRK